MPVYYLVDEVTGENFEVYEGPGPKAGKAVVPTVPPFSELRQKWNFQTESWEDIPPSWARLRVKQRDLIVMHDDLISIHEREVAHDGTPEQDYTIPNSKYQEMLTYFQAIRASDEATFPGDPLAAWNNLDEISKLVGDGGGLQPVIPGYNA